MSDKLSMFSLMSFGDTTSATSSQESVDGAMLCASPDGLMTGKSGLVAARASRSQLPVKELARVTSGTYGLTFFASSVPAGPLSSWENRLRERLGMVGSTEFDLTWKEKTTPAGQLISRLAPSTRPTSDKDCIGSQKAWATPTSAGGRDTY